MSNLEALHLRMRTRSPRDGQPRAQPESRDRDKIDASRTTRRSRDTRTYRSRHFATTCLQLVVSAWTEPHFHLPRFQPFVRQSVVGVHPADRPQDADSTAYTWTLNTVERAVATCMRPGVPWSWREMTRSRVSPNPSSMTSTETFWFTFAPKWTIVNVKAGCHRLLARPWDTQGKRPSTGGGARQATLGPVGQST